MGASKLLLPIRGRPLIASLVESLGEAVERILILVRCDDLRLQEALADLSGVTVVLADREPPDMRHSVQQLLAHLDCSDDNGSNDGWLLTPPTIRLLLRRLWNRCVMAFSGSLERCISLSFRDDEGTRCLSRLAESEGFGTSTIDRHQCSLLRLAEVQVVEHEVGEPSILWDLDTPEDYGRFLQSLEGPPT